MRVGFSVLWYLGLPLFSGKWSRNLIGVIPVALTRLSPLPIRLVPGESPTIGIDRLIVAAAAYDLVRSSVITVDIGTATTIDAVTDQGLFLGGIILPGPKLWLNSFCMLEQQICRRQRSNKKYLLLRHPQRAVSRLGFTMAIDTCWRALSSKCGELAQKSQHDSTIYLTGGSAKYWCEDFPNWCFHPNLLLSGLAQSKVWSKN